MALPGSTPAIATACWKPANFVATIQNRQGFRVSCIEEIAWRKGWIDVDQLYRLGEQLGKTEYGKYLMELAESKR